MILLIFAATAAISLPGCTVVGAAADLTGAVISTTAEVAGDVIGGAAHTVSGSSKNDRESH
jgi:hypothetical protein